MKKSELRQLIREEISKILNENETVDTILDKISSQGINSLTPKEKEYLYRHSKGEKNIPEPITIQNKPVSTSSVKAEAYPFPNNKKPEEIKRHQEQIELYDDIAREFLKPLINNIAQQLEISPKDIRASFDGLWKENNDDDDLSIQIKLPNDEWKKPWTGNNLIMQTENGRGIIINSRNGIKTKYDTSPGATLPEIEEMYDNLYYQIKKEKILNLIEIKLTQFMAGFTYYDLIAPNTPVLYTGK